MYLTIGRLLQERDTHTHKHTRHRALVLGIFYLFFLLFDFGENCAVRFYRELEPFFVHCAHRQQNPVNWI